MELWFIRKKKKKQFIIGASLSEPHSYVLTRTFAIRDIYIYIYINRASDRLALCPRRSNQNPSQIPYCDFAFLWLWLTMISFRKYAGSRALFFVSLPPPPPTASVFSCPLRQTRSDFFDKRSVLLYPSQDFHTQEIGDWRQKFRFRLWWPLIDWLLSAVFGEGARKHWENNQCEESNPPGQKGRARSNPGRHRHFVFSRPGLAFTASPCIAWQVARDRWHLLERARLRFHDGNGACRPRLAPQCLHSLVPTVTLGPKSSGFIAGMRSSTVWLCVDTVNECESTRAEE